MKSPKQQLSEVFMTYSNAVRILQKDPLEDEIKLDTGYFIVLIPPCIAVEMEKMECFQTLKQQSSETLEQDLASTTSNESMSNGEYMKFLPNFAHAKVNEYTKPIFQNISSKIHPVLSDLDIHGVILADRLNTDSIEPTISKSAPVNFIIFHLPHEADLISKTDQKSYFTNISNILKDLNGEAMVDAPWAVIKMFYVSEIVIEGISHELQNCERKYFTAIDKTELSCSLKNNKQKEHDFICTKKLREAEIPSCPVCLHRIDPSCIGFPHPKKNHLCSDSCNHPDAAEPCKNSMLLSPWPAPSYCLACHIIENHESNQFTSYTTVCSNPTNTSGTQMNSSLETSCYECGMKQTLWVCLICGVVGCGRYSQIHANKHYQETGHCFSLELVTQRIWDYAADSFVHRVDLLSCPLIHRINSWNHYPIGRNISTHSTDPYPASLEDSSASQVSCRNSHLPDSSLSSNFNYNPPKKALMIGEEYEALLLSALEDQAQHFEGEISRLRADLAAEQIDERKMSDEETQQIEELQKYIQNLRSEVDCLSGELLERQTQEACLRTTSQRLLRAQAESQQMLDKLRAEASKEHDEGKSQVDELEQQIRDLTANLKMMEQFKQNKELSNAQIYGTTSKTFKRGKKGRRSRR